MAAIEAIIVVCSILIVLIPFFLFVLVFTLPMCPKSNCSGFWKRFPYVILKLLAIPAFFAIIMMIVLMTQMKQYFVENFDKYKCKPWFMPFVSWVKPDVSTSDNFMDCMSKTCGSVFTSMTTPFVDLADDLGTGMNLANQNFAHVQSKHLKLGNSMVSVMSQHTNTMGKYQALAQYLFMKVKAIFDKMLATVFDVYYALVTMLDMVNIAILTPQLLIIAVFIYGAFFFATAVNLLILGGILAATGILLLLFWATEEEGAEEEEEAVKWWAASIPMFGSAAIAFAFGGILKLLNRTALVESRRMYSKTVSTTEQITTTANASQYQKENPGKSTAQQQQQYSAVGAQNQGIGQTS